jgi:hypothetical protein
VVVAVVVAITGAAVALSVAGRDGAPTALTVVPTDQAQDAVPSDAAAFTAERLDPIDVTSEGAGSGSLLPDASRDLTIVAVDGSELVLLDTGSGDHRRIRVAPVTLADSVTVIDDSIIVNAGGDVVRVTDGEIRPVRLAADHLVVPTVAEDAVWVYSGETPYAAGTATLLGLDGQVRDRVALPAVALPLTGTSEHLLVNAPGAITAVEGDGGRTVAQGTALATDGDRLARLDCDSGLRCAIVLGTVDDPDQVRTTLDAEDLPGGFAGLPIGVFSPDGRWLALPRYRTEGRGRLQRVLVTVIDTTTGAEAFRAEGAAARPYGTPLAWSPDSRWLVFVSGRRLHAWPAGGDDARSIGDDVGPVEALAVR